jgi:uncharacterized protein (DUF488 family)
VRLHTVGHSTLDAGAFLALLAAHGVEALCDVRAWPRSRRWPQFNRDELTRALAEAGIAYHWLGRELGGYRRTAREDSPHTALEPGAWRNYADHMESDVFREGIARLLELARGDSVAFMCAEKDWRRCHRRHIADHLVALRQVDVVHILAAGEVQPHRLDRRARLAGDRLVYDVNDPPRLF